MKFRILLIAAIAFGLIVSTSCIPEFENPLPHPKDMKPDRAILGTWETFHEGGESFQMTFLPLKSGGMYIVWINFEKDSSAPPDISIFWGYTTSINKDKFLCLRFIKKVSQDSVDDERKKPMFLIADYNISNKGILSVNMFLQSEISRMIEEGKLKGRIEKGKYGNDVLVTSSSEELVAAIQKYGVESFIYDSIGEGQGEGEGLKFQRLSNEHGEN